MDEARCVAASADRLGEGPVWSSLEGRVYWFDIKGKRLSWYVPDSGATGSLDLHLRASAAAPRALGGLLMATERGLAVCIPEAGTLEIVQPIDLPLGYRTNDGKIDLYGNFWWSSMDDDGGARPGSVFRTTPGMLTEIMLSGIHIPNTLSMSHDGLRMFIADSLRQCIFTHALDEISNPTVFAHTEGTSATPDGSAVDAEGYLWNAQWGGWRVVRYGPDGRVDRIVELPVEQPTSCAFGGPDLTTLYITSAWDGLSADQRAAQPLAGGLFALDTGVKGLALPLFGI
jgi:sugar lactone lactonase YvrE